MNIYNIVDDRQSVRDYHDKEVPVALIEKVLTYALRAPSGGNLQPWNIHVVNGDSINRLKATMHSRLNNADAAEQPEYDIYPPNLKSPYRERRFQIGEALYGQLGIPRKDKAARQAWFLRNFEFFGAPMGLFFTIDRSMGSPQWSDLGMIMQTIMLLLKAEGLDSCAQECWALYPNTVGKFLKLEEEQMLFAGMAVGYGNYENPVNRLKTERADMGEVVTFYG
ncbi:nitroreductase [Oleiphilus messinensis]|uniref:Nitroreductase n=1 Tax=Oleiphilus messinensis TaxID=141451 RepID=A0A1Y0IAU8_9GAMM|nr:nitroreductase family protein [Oleiphilus messinensis]ARU56523.1 nitroreductase [Oleiphilus messinensis]